MAIQGIGTGSSPNDGTGDNLRAAGGKINDNFSELYEYFGDGTTLSRGTWDIVSSGISTLSSVGIGTTNPRFALEVGAVGASGTSLYVNGDARVTGILTVGSSSVTLNGSTNEITVGTGITISGNTGIISATQVTIAGETLTGAGVTSLVAGSNITLSGSTGQVTISSSGSGGGAGAGGTWANYDSNAGVSTTKKVKIENNLEVTGVTTSTGGFVGALTGNASSATVLASSRNIGGVAFNGSGDINLPGVNQSGTQNTSGTAAGLTGTPDINVRNITGVAATFTGVLTYEDVTNIDSIGLVTARSGINIVGGGLTVTGVSTFVGFSTFNDYVFIQDGLNVTGVITATSFVGNGSNLTGIVTSLVAGTNVTISNSNGTYTINSSGGGGGGGTTSQTQTGVALTSISDDSLNLTTGVNADISMIGNNAAGATYASAENKNPSLTWDFNTTSLPAGVAVTSYSVLLEDLRAVDGNGDPLVHWSVSNIPVGITSIPADAVANDITGATINDNFWMTLGQPVNTAGVSVVGYSGPQPTIGENHIYRLSVTAQLSGDSTGTLTQGIEFNFDTTNTLTASPTPTTVAADNLTFTYTTSGGGSSGITTANISADTLVVSGVSTLGIVTGATYYGDASYITAGRWDLGANGSTDYTFTGPGFSGATNDPVLYLARGQTYEFVNTMNAHPFQIRASNGGSAYNTGVTNNGTQNGTVRFEIPMDAPNTLYYQCTSHAAMGNTINIYPTT